jgi:hypothetical protein
MGVEKEKGMNDKLCLCFSVKVLWTAVGFILIGGVYLLSYNNVDETVITEGSRIVDYVRTVLK